MEYDRILETHYHMVQELRHKKKNSPEVKHKLLDNYKAVIQSKEREKKRRSEGEREFTS